MIRFLSPLLLGILLVNFVDNSSLPAQFQQFLLNRNPSTQCLP
jgi:hypothetical protein